MDGLTYTNFAKFSVHSIYCRLPLFLKDSFSQIINNNLRLHIPSSDVRNVYNCIFGI